MNSFNLRSISWIFYGLFLKSVLVSIINTFEGSQSLNHSSCLSWILCRYSKGIQLSSALILILVRSQHFSGLHLRQMILVCSILAMDWKVGYKDLKISYSLSSIQPRSCINCENTNLSARMLRQDILIFQGKLAMAQCIFWMRVKMAQIWKVKPHLLGYWQYFSSMLMFFQFRFCHYLTGYSIQQASETSLRKIQRKVDFPHPMLPSIVQKNYRFGTETSIVARSLSQVGEAVKFYIQIMYLYTNLFRLKSKHQPHFLFSLASSCSYDIF